MRKIIRTVFLLVAATVMFACSGGNTPTTVAEKAVKCLQNEDYEGYVDLMHIDKKEVQDIENTKQMYTSLLKEKAGSDKSGIKGIKSFETVSEEISEDGNKAKVTMKLIMDGDKEKTETIKLIKEENGDWKLDSGK